MDWSLGLACAGQLFVVAFLSVVAYGGGLLHDRLYCRKWVTVLVLEDLLNARIEVESLWCVCSWCSWCCCRGARCGRLQRCALRRCVSASSGCRLWSLLLLVLRREGAECIHEVVLWWWWSPALVPSALCGC